MSEYIFDVPDANQPIAGDSSVYYPDERDEPMIVREEIVRCRDCRWYREEWIRKLMRDRIYCDWLDGAHVEPEGFCAWGERRERESAEVWNQWSADDVTCSEES